MKKTLIATLLTMAMLLPMVTVGVGAVDESGTGLLAVNTNVTTFDASDSTYTNSGESTGVFSVATAASVASIEEDSTAGIMGYDALGRGIVALDSSLREVVANEGGRSVLSTTNFQLGSTKTFTFYANVETVDSMEFKVIATSQYCNIWVPTATNYTYLLTDAQGEQLAAEYDATIYPALLDYFGGFEYADKDGDGKVNILCYDIGEDGATATTYVGGYFYTGDLVYDGLDLLHVDSAQGMNGGTDVSMAYSTVAHELQHMIAYSVGAVKGSYLPTFVDEAFAMAAEHLIYGTQYSRIYNYNTSTDIPNGTVSLTAWESDLDNYSLSYLFGQYLRTQYAQQDDVSAGSDIYKDLFEKLQKTKYTEAEIVAQLATMVGAGTTADLLVNFYAAIAEKDDTGDFGFNGEEWADLLYPTYLTSGATVNLKQGCAVYFGAYTATPSNQGDNIVFQSISVPTITGVPSITITCDGATLTQNVGSSISQATVTMGDTITLKAEDSGGYTGGLLYIWFKGEYNSGNNLTSVSNQYADSYTIDTTTAGTWQYMCQATYGDGTVQSTNYVNITVEVNPNVIVNPVSTTETTTTVEVGYCGFDGFVFCAVYDDGGKFLDVEQVSSTDDDTWQTETVTLQGTGEVKAFGVDNNHKPVL